MTAIQTLRAEAKAKGTLKSSSQITVVQQSPQTIIIQPTNPQIVYVPQYNPVVVYGTPYVVPGETARLARGQPSLQKRPTASTLSEAFGCE